MAEVGTQTAPKEPKRPAQATPTITPPGMPKGELRGAEDRQDEPMSSREAVVAAGKGQRLSVDEQSAATDWFMSDEPEDDSATVKVIEINVGGTETEAQKWIPWTIQAVDLDTLRRIRRMSQGNRATRRAGGGELDEVEANMRIVVEGTLDPPLVQLAMAKGIADPTVALRFRFERKPGLIGQIAGEIMALSGYDDEDVREAQAAGN